MCGHEDTRCVSLVISSNATSATSSGRGEKATSGSGSGNGSGSGSARSSTRKRCASDITSEPSQNILGILSTNSNGQGQGQGRWCKLDCLSGGVLMERTLPPGG